MRIAMVCPYDLGMNGGVQDQATRLTGWLGELGHSVVLVGPGTEGPEGSVLLGGTRTVKANQAATPLRLDPRVRSQIKDVFADVDVAHIHEPLMPAVSLAATRIGHLPKVGTFHADPPKWVRRTYRGSGPLLRRVVSKLDVVTATSSVSRSAIDRFTTSRIIPNGVELSAYGASDKREGSVVFLGRDDQRKGLDVLLEAWPLVAAQVPAANLTVIGADRPSDRKDVSYLGRVSESEKASVLSRSGVYCAPNLGGESFGIVLAEAMASGCAIVASALPAFAHVAGGSAELVAPGDANGLAERIIAVLTDDGRRAALQSAALERSKAFDGLTIASLFVDAYSDAVAGI